MLDCDHLAYQKLIVSMILNRCDLGFWTMSLSDVAAHVMTAPGT